MAKLHFYYSAMNAGKSTMLLQSAHNYNERGMDTMLFMPQFDTRFGAGKITSRIGLSAPAFGFDKDLNIYNTVSDAVAKNSNIKCILIDESQFLSKRQVGQLCDIADVVDIPVLAYGIRSDFRGEPFPGSLYLLSWADLLIEIKTICHCGKKATMNMRIDADGNPVREGQQVEIGGNERYLAVCRRHLKEALGYLPLKEKESAELAAT